MIAKLDLFRFSDPLCLHQFFREIDLKELQFANLISVSVIEFFPRQIEMNYLTHDTRLFLKLFLDVRSRILKDLRKNELLSVLYPAFSAYYVLFKVSKG